MVSCSFRDKRIRLKTCAYGILFIAHPMIFPAMALYDYLSLSNSFPSYTMSQTHLTGSLGEELECGEPLDGDLLHLILCRVHLGNDNFFVVLEMLTQLVPDWS